MSHTHEHNEEKEYTEPGARLYVVGTPIGNLEDITLRAIAVLQSVDLILCEDTRVTRNLLERYQIATPTVSYHSHTTGAKTEKILEFLEQGKNLALVSDAGTPGISDPGSLLVSQVRQHLPQVKVFAVPGASALTSALSIAGLPCSDFLFLGFLPHKKGRETLFKEIADSKRTVVFYESPHRVLKSLVSLSIHFKGSGTEERRVVIAREITKIYEEVVSGTVPEIEKYFFEHPEKVKGEFVVIVEAL